MGAKLEPILNNLSRAQAGLLRAADAISPEQWKTNPAEGAWSAAEVVGHLIMVERAVIAGADRVLQKPPKATPLLKRFHLPMALVEARLIRRKSPIPVDPQLIHEKEEMLAELRGVRERSLAFISETKTRDLSGYGWRHPFLGRLNIYGWFQMIASHENRHTKQMQQIAARLPNCVARSQK